MIVLEKWLSCKGGCWSRFDYDIYIYIYVALSEVIPNTNLCKKLLFLYKRASMRVIYFGQIIMPKHLISRTVYTLNC